MAATAELDVGRPGSPARGGTIAGCVTELIDGPTTGTISGVALSADLYDYRVFPRFGGGFIAFGGSCFSHDIAKALEDAVDDGMDVDTLSLGGRVHGQHDLHAASATGCRTLHR